MTESGDQMKTEATAEAIVVGTTRVPLLVGLEMMPLEDSMEQLRKCVPGIPENAAPREVMQITADFFRFIRDHYDEMDDKGRAGSAEVLDKAKQLMPGLDSSASPLEVLDALSQAANFFATKYDWGQEEVAGAAAGADDKTTRADGGEGGGFGAAAASADDEKTEEDDERERKTIKWELVPEGMVVPELPEVPDDDLADKWERMSVSSSTAAGAGSSSNHDCCCEMMDEEAER